MNKIVNDVKVGLQQGITKILLGISFILLTLIVFFAAAQRVDAAPVTTTNVVPQAVDVQEPAPVEDATPTMSKTGTAAVTTTEAIAEVEVVEDDEPIVYVLMDNAKQLWVSVVERYETYMHEAEVNSAPPTVTDQAPGSVTTEVTPTEVK